MIMDTLGNFTLMEAILAAAVLAIIAGIVILDHLDGMELFWLNLRSDLPFIGRVATFSRDRRTEQRGLFRGWFQGELRLCRGYASLARPMTPDEFKSHRTYLQKATDAETCPMGSMVVALGFLFAAGEAYAVGYLLSQFWSSSASEHTLQVGGTLTGMVIAAALLVLSHLAGRDLKRWRTLREARLRWGESSEDLFRTANIGLNDDQSRDDALPEFCHLANRASKSPRHPWWTFIFAVTLSSLLVLVVGLRLHDAERAQARADATQQTFFDDAGANQSTPATATPPALSKIDAATWNAAVAFGLIAAMWHMAALGIAARHTFVGDESAKAHRKTRGCATYAEYLDAALHRITDAAQPRLTALQTRLAERQIYEGNVAPKLSGHSFDAYLHLRQLSEAMQPQIAYAHSAFHANTRLYHVELVNGEVSETPYAVAELRQMVTTGQLSLHSRACDVALPGEPNDWKPLSELLVRPRAPGVAASAQAA